MISSLHANAAGIAPDRHFVPVKRKAGGAYVTVTGRVRHVSVPEQTLVMEDGTEIPMEDVVSMTGGIFCCSLKRQRRPGSLPTVR